jgi:hypothetical protein
VTGYDAGYLAGRDEMAAEIGYSLCPYQYGLGTCTMGCRDEPACQTSGPWDYTEQINDLLLRERMKAAEPGLSVGALDERIARHRGENP